MVEMIPNQNSLHWDVGALPVIHFSFLSMLIDDIAPEHVAFGFSGETIVRNRELFSLFEASLTDD